MDLLFIVYPLTTTYNLWHLGLRSMIALLRKRGFTAGLIYPKQITLSKPKRGEIKEILLEIENYRGWPNNQPGSIFSPMIEEMIEEIKRKDPLLIGFPVYDGALPVTLQFIRRLKEKKVRAKFVLGGHYATFTHETILKKHPEIDFIVRGEGEETICELVDRLKKGGSLAEVRGLSYRDGKTIRINPPRALIDDLNELPPPVTDYYNVLMKGNGEAKKGEKKKFAERVAISSSRGCFYNCSYCSIQTFYRNSPRHCAWRPLSPKRVVDEMQRLQKMFGAYRFNFVDDTFLGKGVGKQRAIEIAKEIIKRRLKVKFSVSARADEIDEKVLKELKKAGLDQVFMGIESNFQRGLDTFNKHLKVEDNHRAIALLAKLGLLVNIVLIFFDPYLKPQEAMENLALIRQLQANRRRNFIGPYVALRIYQGIPLIAKLKREGLLRGNYLGYSFKFIDPAVQDLYSLVLRLPIWMIEFLKSLLRDLHDRVNTDLIRLHPVILAKRGRLADKVSRLLYYYSEYYYYYFMVRFIEQYLNGTESERRLVEDRVLAETARIRNTYYSLFAALLGGTDSKTSHKLVTNNGSFIFLGQNMTFIKIEKYPAPGTHAQRALFRGLNDLGLLSVQPDMLLQPMSHFQDRRLTALTIEGCGLDYDKFEQILNSIGSRFRLDERTMININSDGKNIPEETLKRISGFCRKKRLKLRIVRVEDGPAAEDCPSCPVFNLPQKNHYHCLAGISSFYIDSSDGNIYACRKFKGIAAMVLGNGYRGEWNETVWTAFVDATVDKKTLCFDCWAKYVCGGGCAFKAFSRNHSLYQAEARDCGRIKSACERGLKDHADAIDREQKNAGKPQ